MYIKVVKDIIEYYSYYINKDELIALSNIVNNIKDIEDKEIDDNIISYINNILKRIWDNTNTNINEYETGKKFCFLVKEKDYVVDVVTLNMADVNKNKIRLITDKDIVEYGIEKFGTIIKLDYSGNNRTTPLLPIYFNNSYISVDNLNYDVIALYSIDTMIGDLDSNYNELKEKSELENLPYILIDKTKYKRQEDKNILTHHDLEEIARIFIIEYLYIYKYKFNKFLKYKNKFLKNNKVHKEILKYYNNKIDLETLKNTLYSIFEEIEKEIDILDNKKKNVL